MEPGPKEWGALGGRIRGKNQSPEERKASSSRAYLGSAVSAISKRAGDLSPQQVGRLSEALIDAQSARIDQWVREQLTEPWLLNSDQIDLIKRVLFNSAPASQEALGQ